MTTAERMTGIRRSLTELQAEVTERAATLLWRRMNAHRPAFITSGDIGCWRPRHFRHQHENVRHEHHHRESHGGMFVPGILAFMLVPE